MRKFLISATLLASSLAIATPAAAQLRVTIGSQYGNGYGYGNQYGYGNRYGYGYNNNYGGARSLQIRLNNLERQINVLDSRNILSEREADQLRREANWIERQVRQSGRNGLNGYERRNLEVRLARLEQNIRYQANDGNRYGQRDERYGNGQYGYGNGYNSYDRDRDGRDDRYEDDRGYRRD